MALHKPKSDAVRASDSSSTDIGEVKASEPQGNHRNAPSVTCYENGLVNLEKTPAHLLPIVQSNAKSSLLRLPPEIREVIWNFACGGHWVAVWPHWRPHGASQIQIQAVRAKHTLDPLSSSYSPGHHVSAFILPRVCRQIYSETALTAYRENVFRLDGPDDLRMMDTFIEAQRNAIVALDPVHAIIDMASKPTQLGPWLATCVRKVLPNFQWLHVTEFSLYWTHARCVMKFADTMPKEDKELLEAKDKRAWFLRRYTGISEAGIEIIFQD